MDLEFRNMTMFETSVMAMEASTSVNASGVARSPRYGCISEPSLNGNP